LPENFVGHAGHRREVKRKAIGEPGERGQHVDLSMMRGGLEQVCDFVLHVF
jgi:hypothetical protein